jgi:putative oxidoreductase
MKKITSINYSTTAFNVATLLLRSAFGILMFLDHGLMKINKFNDIESIFPDPFHVGHRISLIVVIFAEAACSLFLVLGLFSRLAALILFIDVAVAVFFVHLGQPIVKFELPILYSIVFFSLVLIGPGNISIDGRNMK